MYPARTSSWCEATIASAGTSFRVGVNDLDILMRRSPLLLQLPIHRLLHLLVRLGAVDEHAVDEERGGAVDARGASGLQVLLDQGLLLSAVQALVELRGVDAHRLRVALQVVDTELALIAEHLVVELPELALLLRAGPSLRRFLRERVEVERIVPEDEAHLAVVFLHQALDHRDLLAAIRALEVAELHDRDRSARRSARWPLGLHFDARNLGRLERNLDLVLRLQLLEDLSHVVAELLLADGLLDARLEVVEGLALRDLRLVLLVEGLRLGVGGLGNRVHVVGLQPLLERLALGLCLLLEQAAADQLIEQVPPLVVEVGQRLHFRLPDLWADLLVRLQIAVGAALSVHLCDPRRRVESAGRRCRPPACLAGDEGGGTGAQHVQTTALHDSLQTRRTADPKRAGRLRQHSGTLWRSRTPAPARSRRCSSASRPWRWWGSRPTPTAHPTASPCTCSKTATASSPSAPAAARSSARKSMRGWATSRSPWTWPTTSARARWWARTSTRRSGSASPPSGCRRASSTRPP